MNLPTRSSGQAFHIRLKFESPKPDIGDKPKMTGTPAARRAPAKGNIGSNYMAISRRDVLLGSAGALGAATFSFSKARFSPVRADQDRAALRDDRAELGADHRFQPRRQLRGGCHQRAGGVKGRKIEAIIRDTQGDPTKAVTPPRN